MDEGLLREGGIYWGGGGETRAVVGCGGGGEKSEKRGEPERGEKNVSETARRGGTKRRSRAETRWKRSRSGRRRPGTDPPRASRASGDGRGVGSRGFGRGRWAREARGAARDRAPRRGTPGRRHLGGSTPKNRRRVRKVPPNRRGVREKRTDRGGSVRGATGGRAGGGAPSTSASATLPRLCLSGYRCCGEPMVDCSSDPRSLSLRVVMRALKPFASRGMPPQTAKTSDAGRARTPGRARRFLRFA